MKSFKELFLNGLAVEAVCLVPFSECKITHFLHILQTFLQLFFKEKLLFFIKPLKNKNKENDIFLKFFQPKSADWRKLALKQA